MKISIRLIFTAILIISISAGCKKDKETHMVDMDSIETDGSRDDMYIFRKEIKKEESRGKKYKKNNF